MTAPQAVARCPQLIIRTVQLDAEAEARAALLAIGFTLSPSVEDTAPGVCTVDLKGRDPTKLPTAVQTAIVELMQAGLPATCGIADTPLLALYAARSAERIRSNSTRPVDLEKINKTGSESVLRITDAGSFLAPLPLSVADPSPELASVLFQWGLRTLGDLLALSRDEIIRRFGAAGLALWNRASGGVTRPLHPVALPHAFFATMEFEESLETLEPLLFILRRFLDRLTLELRATQFATAEVELTLYLEDDTQHARRFRLPEPTADAEILFRTLYAHLESLQTIASISALALRFVPTRPLVRQQGLFESGLRDAHGFSETLARAMAIIGSDRVGTPQPDDTHRPDAFALVTPAAVIPAPVVPPIHSVSGLSLRRYRPPRPARLEFSEGRATYLWTEQIHGEITAQSLAWPSDGDWWQSDRAWSRSECDISLGQGGLYRLLRTDHAYFLEGEYD